MGVQDGSTLFPVLVQINSKPLWEAAQLERH